MNGIDQYSEYMRGAEPTEEQIERRADEIYENMSYEAIGEMWVEEIGDPEEIGKLVNDHKALDVISRIEDKLRRGEME